MRACKGGTVETAAGSWQGCFLGKGRGGGLRLKSGKGRSCMVACWLVLATNCASNCAHDDVGDRFSGQMLQASSRMVTASVPEDGLCSMMEACGTARNKQRLYNGRSADLRDMVMPCSSPTMPGYPRFAVSQMLINWPHAAAQDKAACTGAGPHPTQLCLLGGADCVYYVEHAAISGTQANLRTPASRP